MQSQETQKFCRTCGFALSQVAALLAEQREENQSLLTPQEQRTEQLVGRGINALLSTLGIGLLAMIVFGVVIRAGNFRAGLFLLGLCSLIALWITLIGKWTDLQNLKAARAQRQMSPPASTGNTGKILSASHEQPLTSITERTTDLLGIPTSRKRSGELP